MTVDHYCWLCHRECSSKLACTKCDRNYHLSCVSELRPHLVRGSDGLKKFAKVCPECSRTAEATKKWTRGRDFEPITRKTLNNLLLYILGLIKQEAPEPFLWPSNRFRGCVHQMDVDKIEQRAKDNFYDSPKDFLNDVYLINHNCMILSQYASKLSIDRSMSYILVGYNEKIEQFKSTIDKKVRYLEDCPHCIWNFTLCPMNWLTMACPWGHPLIITEVGKKLRPAKMIKFNRASGRVDIILFGSSERTRVFADKCWVPSASDLAIDKNRESQDLLTAKKQAQMYIEALEKRLKIKITFNKERKILSALDKDYVKRSSPREDVDDIIELTDDESSVVSENHDELDESNSNSNKEADEETDEVNGDGKNLNNYMIEDDEIIDEVNADESSSEAKQSDSPLPLLKTIIEPASPIPDSNTTSVDGSSKPTQIYIPIYKPMPTDISIPIPTPTSTPPLTSITIPTSTSTPPPPLTPTPPPINEQFSIVSDDELDTPNRIDLEPTDEDDPLTNSIKSLLSSEFVVEEDRDSIGDTLSPKFQPISPCYFTCTHDDKIFESTISSNNTSNHLLSDPDFQFSEHQTKKIKLDQHLMDTKFLSEIKRLEQQLEFAEREKQLNLQQINEIQEQLKLTKQMEGTKLKTVELQLSSQINSLKDTIENERKDKEVLNKKLIESVAKGYRLIRELESTNASWESRLAKELQSRDDQHKKEMDSKLEEIASLKRKLQESEDATKKLEQKYNIILPKYNKLSTKLLSLSQEFGDDDKVNSSKL